MHFKISKGKNLCISHHMKATFSEVTECSSLDWKTAKNIYKKGLKEDYREIDYSGLRVLAVNEISMLAPIDI